MQCRNCQPHVETEFLDRRDFLRRSGAGFGLLGLAGVLSQEAFPHTGVSRDASPLAPKSPHFAPRATSCIFLFMYGGPSGIDLFEPKPVLDQMHGKSAPQDLMPFFGRQTIGTLMKSPYQFQRHGQSGQWVSEKFPHLATCIDDMAFLKGCHCDSNNHAPALIKMNCGVTRVGHPSIGSWLTYGLGTENQNMPGYVVMYDHRGGPINGSQNWSAGFLPSHYQATPFRSTGAPILNLDRDPTISRAQQRRQLDLIARLSDRFRSEHPAESDIQGPDRESRAGLSNANGGPGGHGHQRRERRDKRALRDQ